MTDDHTHLADALDRIAQLPLAERAAAYLELHAQLGVELEQADSVHA